MIIQSCPRCGSSRIRRGYRPTPWWQAIFGRYNLLCNSCNWEFVGLAIPGTVPEHLRKRKKQTEESNQVQPRIIAKEVNSFAETQELSETVSLNDSNHQNFEEIIDDSSTDSKHTQLIAEPNSDNNGEGSPARSIINAIDETEGDINKLPELAETLVVNIKGSDNLKLGIKGADKPEYQLSQNKKRMRTKRKK